MTNNVISFQKETMIWVCECGCSTFSLLSDGGAECANCETLHPEGGGWRDDNPKKKVNTAGEAKRFKDTKGNGSIEFAKARMTQIAGDSETVLVVCATENGSLHAWSHAKSEDQINWVEEMLTDALGLIKAKAETLKNDEG